MVLYGTLHRLGDNITTEQIIAPSQRSENPAELAAHCLASVDPGLAEHAAEGDMLLAGQDFGAGDDPEIAVLALQALGIAAVICRSAARTFVEVAEQYGMPVIEMPEAVETLSVGAVVRLDLERGELRDRSSNERFRFPPASPALLAAVRRATLLSRMRRVVEDEGFDG